MPSLRGNGHRRTARAAGGVSGGGGGGGGGSVGQGACRGWLPAAVLAKARGDGAAEGAANAGALPAFGTRTSKGGRRNFPVF